MSGPPDPTLERIRQVRNEISAEFGDDPQKLVEYYMRLQERHGNRLLHAVQRVASDEEPTA